MNPMKKTARTAGFWYLLMAITGPLGLVYVPSNIFIAGDAAATANNILSSETLYRISIISNLICQTVFIFLVLALYRLFKDVDKKYALLMVALVIVSVPIAFLSILFQAAPLFLLSGSAYQTLAPNQLHAQVMMFIDLYNHGTTLAEIFWGLWLFPFGILVIKSGFIPKILGILLIIACFGYLASSVATILFPAAKNAVGIFTSIAGTVGEFSILLWLLIKGVKDQQTKGNMT